MDKISKILIRELQFKICSRHDIAEILLMLALNTNQSIFLEVMWERGECSSLYIQCICTKKEVFFVDNILCGFGKFTGSM